LNISNTETTESEIETQGYEKAPNGRHSRESGSPEGIENSGFRLPSECQNTDGKEFFRKPPKKLFKNRPAESQFFVF
jgi:hypothetical protein